MGSLANFAFLVFAITFVGYHVKAHHHKPQIRITLEEHLGNGHVHFEKKQTRPDTRVWELKQEFSNRHHCPMEHVVVKYRDRIVTEDLPLQNGGHQHEGREHYHGRRAHHHDHHHGHHHDHHHDHHHGHHHDHHYDHHHGGRIVTANDNDSGQSLNFIDGDTLVLICSHHEKH